MNARGELIIEEVARVYNSTVTNFMELRGNDKREAFTLFKEARFGYSLLSYVACAFISAVFVIYWIDVLSIFNAPLSIFASAFTFGVAIPSMWLLTFLKRQRMRANDYSTYPKNICMLENMVMLLFTAILIMIILMRTFNGQCQNLYITHILHCTPSLVGKGLPVDTMLVLSVIPYFCLSTLPGISMKAVISCYVATVGLQAFCMQYTGAVLAVTWVIVLDIIVACLIYIQRFTQLQLFIFFTKYEELQRERTLDSERQQQDTRSLIGKLAHDLRTPLVSMTCGLEMMQESMDYSSCPISLPASEEGPCSFSPLPSASAPPLKPIATSAGKAAVERKDSYRSLPACSSMNSMHSMHGDVNIQDTYSLMGEVREVLGVMEGAHVQMMMIINRCTDYHKLACKIPLVPKYAPVKIRYLLKTMAKYAENLQNHGEKEEGGGDSDGVQYTKPPRRRLIIQKVEYKDVLVTDVIWLQDNLMSVISNAMRFSPSHTPCTLNVIKCSCKESDDKWEIVDEGGKVFYPYSSPSAPPTPTTPSHDTESSSPFPLSSRAADPNRQLSQSAKSHTPPLHISQHQTSPLSIQLQQSPMVAPMVRFEVEDFGVGIDGVDDGLSPFSAPDTSTYRSMGGAGMGLYCLAERVKALRGRYGLINKKTMGGKGCVVWFALPIGQEMDGSANRERGGSSRRGLRTSSGMMHGHKEASSVCSSSSIGTSDSILDEETSVHKRDDNTKSNFDFCASLGADFEKERNSIRGTIPTAVVGQPADNKANTANNALECAMEFTPTTKPPLPPRIPQSPQPPSQTPHPAVATLAATVPDTSKPLSVNSDTSSNLAASTPHEPSPTLSDNKATVLILDDSPMVLKMLRLMLEKTRQYRVITHTNGYEALEAIQKSLHNQATPIHTLLVDMQMPIIDGLEVIERYQKLLSSVAPADAANPPSTTSFPLLIAMSANADEQTMQAAYSAGAMHFLQKPFSVDTFRNVQDELLGRKKAEGE